MRNKTSKNKKKSFEKYAFSVGSAKEKDYFIENIGMLVSSGISLLEAIEIIEEDVKSKRMKKTLSFIKEEIKGGSPMWRALAKTSFFSDHIIALIRIGEESGKLSENLKIAAKEEEKSRELKSKIYSAMIYPAFVFFMGSFIGIGIAWFILPRLAVTFSQLEIELPLLTKALISLGSFLGVYGIYFIPGLIILLLIVIFFFFVFAKTKFIGQWLLFHIPIIGNIIKEVEMARFGYFLGILLDAGIPIKKAISSLSKSTELLPYKRFYNYLQKQIEEGNSFKKSFSSYKKVDSIFPLAAQRIIFAAEKSGFLSVALIKIGKRFEERADKAAKNLTVILEPLMLLVVAMGVAFVAIAIILPMYGLIGGINQDSKPTQPSQEVVAIEDISKNEEVIEKVVEDRSQKIRSLSVSNDYLVVYGDASEESDIIDRIMPGEEMYYILEKNNWYKILLNNNEIGWIKKEHTEIIKENEN